MNNTLKKNVASATSGFKAKMKMLLVNPATAEQQKANLVNKAKCILARINRALVAICRRSTVYAVIGFILQMTTQTIWPEFPSQFPAVYAWFVGWSQLYEISVKILLSLLSNLVHLRLGELLPDILEAIQGLGSLAWWL